MKGIIYLTYLLLTLPCFSVAQQITYSEPLREDNRDIVFDIIGKMNGNILVFKNIRWKYGITVYNADNMDIKEKVNLDFMPDRTFNVDYVAFSNSFYLFYQYQRKGVVYCMAAKMDANAKQLGEPVQLDTTHVGLMGDNKIYSTINSDDKKKIMIFKIQRKEEQLHFATLLFNEDLQLIHKTRQPLEYNERQDTYGDFLLDNEGNFLFAKSVKAGNRSNISSLFLLTKPSSIDTFSVNKINLNDFFIDEVKLKVDNINRRYIINSFFYTERRGNIDGIFCATWDIATSSANAIVFTKLDDSIRNEAKAKGNFKLAFNDFFIRNILLKKDGGYLITAEDYSTQSSGNNMGWNRWDYLYGSPFMNSYNYYFYNPSYGGYYRPYNRFNSNQTVRYYYDNILLLNVDKSGRVEWGKVINKEQYGDDNDNFLSYSIFNTGSEIHFLYNLIEKREKLLTDNTITFNGRLKRNPTLKSRDKGYEFMPKPGKQISARQLIVPCLLRNQVCFAKIDF